MKKLLFILLATLYCLQGIAQEDSIRIQNNEWIRINNIDSLKQAPFYEKETFIDRKNYLLKKEFQNQELKFALQSPSFNIATIPPYAIIPTAMIAYGVLTQNNKGLRNIDKNIASKVEKHLNTRTSIDDYSQYAPLASIFALDLCGIKARHNFRDRTIITASSYAIMGLIVNTMKISICVPRPDNSNDNSFPSGHTATAFTGAHLLSKEYYKTSPWIGIAGYGVAAATGVMRVTNKKHWLSDVVTGAGVGIISAEAGYRLLPIMHKILGIKNKDTNLAIIPACSAHEAGVGVSYIF